MLCAKQGIFQIKQEPLPCSHNYIPFRRFLSSQHNNMPQWWISLIPCCTLKRMHFESFNYTTHPRSERNSMTNKEFWDSIHGKKRGSHTQLSRSWVSLVEVDFHLLLHRALFIVLSIVLLMMTRHKIMCERGHTQQRGRDIILLNWE